MRTTQPARRAKFRGTGVLVMPGSASESSRVCGKSPGPVDVLVKSPKVTPIPLNDTTANTAIPAVLALWRLKTNESLGFAARRLGPIGAPPSSRQVKWTSPCGALSNCTPTIGPAGTLYINSKTFLTAMKPDGTLKWQKSVSSCFSSTDSVVASDGTIYLASKERGLYAIQPDGTLKWCFDIQGHPVGSAAIAADGTVLVGSTDHYLYAIDSEGKLRWKFRADEPLSGSPAIDGDGTLYIGSADLSKRCGKLYALRSDGSLKWQIETEGSRYAPAVATDGTVYVDDGLNLSAIAPDGQTRWKFPSKAGFTTSPTVCTDGTILVGDMDGELHAIHPDGRQKWTFATEGCMASCPAVGSDGTIYVGSSDGLLYAINPEGSKKWEVAVGIGGPVRSSPTLGEDGSLWVCGDDGALYALGPEGSLQ